MANPFTGAGSQQSQVIRTDQELRNMARAAEAKRLAQAQRAYERRVGIQDERQTAAAQALIDDISAKGGLSWDPVESFAYGEFATPGTLTGFDETGLDPKALYAITGDDTRWGGTQYGSIEGGEGWIPTMDEAKSILDAWGENDRLNYQYAGGYQTPQDIIRSALGDDVPQQFVDYLAAQTNFREPTGAPAPVVNGNNLMNFMPGGAPSGWTDIEIKAMDAPFLYGRSGTLNPGRDAFSDLMAGVVDSQGLGGNDFMKKNELQNALTIDYRAPSSQWGEISSRLRQEAEERARNTQAQNDAYQRYTLGNNYWGGVINDQYAQPFGGRLEGYDQNNPLSYFGWDGSRFGQAGTPDMSGAGGRFGAGGHNRSAMTQQNPMQGPWGSSGWGGPFGGSGMGMNPQAGSFGGMMGNLLGQMMPGMSGSPFQWGATGRNGEFWGNRAL